MILSWTVLAGGLATMVLTAILVVLSYTPVPTVDHWAFIYQIAYGKTDMWDFRPQSAPASIWAILWAPHNGHRIIFPKLFYLADLMLFGGRNIFLRGSVYALQLVQLGFIGYLLARLGNFSRSGLRSAIGVAAFWLFCPAQRDVFVSGWEVAYVLPFVCATAAFGSLALIGRRTSKTIPIGMGIAWTLAAIGSYSLANGFLIWPMLLVEIVALRLPRKTFWITVFLMALAIGLNFIGYRGGANTDFHGALHSPQKVASLFFIILAVAWKNAGYYIGVALAAIGIVLSAAWVVRDLFAAGARDRLRIALLCTGVYMILTIALTSLARSDLGFAGRYEAGAVVFWCVLAVATYRFFERRWMNRGLVAVQIATCLVMIAGLKQVKPLMRGERVYKQWFTVAEAALAANVNDASAVQWLGNPRWTLGSLPFLAAHKASLYSMRPGSLIGTNMASTFAIDRNSCRGAVEATLPVGDPTWPGVELTGWARDRSDGRPVDELLFANHSGKIIGLGSSNRLIQAPAPGTNGTDAAATWKGFLPRGTQPEAVYVYGIISPDKVCTLTASEPVKLSRTTVTSSSWSYTKRLYLAF